MGVVFCQDFVFKTLLQIYDGFVGFFRVGGPFSTYFDGFYASNGLCLPLHIHNPYDAGEFSFKVSFFAFFA